METLVVAHHRSHHRFNNPVCGPTKFDSFDSSSPEIYTGISCRAAYQSGAGLLPTPLKSFSTPVAKNALSAPLSPKTPSPYFVKNQKGSKGSVKIGTAPIPIKMNFENKEREYRFSERWAGPTYSNSPPPSSLPLPKFSMRPKRTVSLDLPSMVSEIDLHPIAKSAPASPTRWNCPSPNDLFDNADSATKTLRRILNLDISSD
ncbi:hypothetical protein ABFS82_14G200800 [Erythranthe guttata]|uniref:Uncharacterized protein n=1 Tax=Erythranthe guttata TaxID=4155 RepID=A0A022RKE8_ERYGU|nr:PREDICTED: uncharacterized protein LOC105954109 [Erythranthe guttata]EYU40907.1 hypothetical protein MIMGU_mgv1a019539mg [Erythranthe guttata]|eukprot:XP_012833235.1 PREDICTED: uncharacterized protein LOC105954109 [Erythranthe guttata]